MRILLKGFAYERSAGLYATYPTPFFNAKLDLVWHVEADIRIVSFLNWPIFLLSFSGVISRMCLVGDPSLLKSSLGSPATTEGLSDVEDRFWPLLMGPGGNGKIL